MSDREFPEVRIAERLKTAKQLADKLLSAPCYDFAGLTPSKLENGLAVVYAIFDKTDHSTLYVGRTKNLRQRLYSNHLMGPANNARLKSTWQRMSLGWTFRIWKQPSVIRLTTVASGISQKRMSEPGDRLKGC